MQDFVYHVPTKVYFGKKAEEKTGAVLAEDGYRRVMLLYGGGSVVRSGLLDRIKNSLRENGITWCELGGVEPNPKIDLVRKGAPMYRQEKADFLLAVGGGSVIDTGKSICMSVANDMDAWYMIQNAIVPQKMLPMGSVLTIAAAGSEMSWSHVISNPASNDKCSLNHDILRPKYAFMNPENTFSVSAFQTACGVIDMMMHTMERYLTAETDSDLMDRISEGLLISVRDAGRIAVKEPENYEARSTLMWAGSLAHNGVTGCGKVTAYWAAHKIDQYLAGFYDHVAHGAGLSVLYPAWAKYVAPHDPRKFALLATRVWDVPYAGDDLLGTAMKGIQAFEDYCVELGMPIRMGQLEVPAESYERIALACTKNGTVPMKSLVDLDKDVIVKIFNLATY